MHIKIQGGTVQNGQSSLWQPCRHATVVRGSRLHDEIVECAVLRYSHGRIVFPVTSCTDYVNRQHPGLHEMEDAAWILRTDARRTRIGFVPAKDLKLKDRYVLSQD